jgi:hypothetical protein
VGFLTRKTPRLIFDVPREGGFFACFFSENITKKDEFPKINDGGTRRFLYGRTAIHYDAKGLQ